MRIDLSLVEVFCCVYEEASFSRAAARLRISQPTVSGHVKNLEEYIGARLFDRLPRRVQPTRAGEILYRHGKMILSEKQAAVQELKKFLNDMEGSLTIACSTIPGEYLMPRLIAAYHSEFPAVSVEMRISDSEQVCNDVMAGKVELGFIGARIDAIGVDLRYFASDELVLVAPANPEWSGLTSITLDDLLLRPFLARQPGSGTMLAFEKNVGISMDAFNVVGRFGSSGAIKEALKAGMGVSILSRLAVQPEVSAGLLKIIRIDGLDAIRREFFAVSNRSLTHSPICESFLEFVLEASANGSLAAHSQ